MYEIKKINQVFQLMKNDDGFMKYIKNIDRLNDNNQTIRPDHDPVIPKCHLKDMILKRLNWLMISLNFVIQKRFAIYILIKEVECILNQYFF